MIIYNNTSGIDHSLHQSWLQWMQDEHIPEILGTGLFEKHVLVRLLDIDESESITYALQLYVASRGRYNQYQEKYGNDLRKKSAGRWGNSVTSFRTLMQVVEG